MTLTKTREKPRRSGKLELFLGQGHLTTGNEAGQSICTEAMQAKELSQLRAYITMDAQANGIQGNGAINPLPIAIVLVLRKSYGNNTLHIVNIAPAIEPQVKGQSCIHISESSSISFYQLLISISSSNTLFPSYSKTNLQPKHISSFLHLKFNVGLGTPSIRTRTRG